MDGSILTNIAALQQIKSDYSTLANTSANISSELRQDANDLSVRIQNCLDDAMQKRIECEIKLQEAIQRQQEIASMGGDSPAGAVSYAASLMFEAEIAVREAELLNAERIENDIRSIQSDYSNQIRPLLSAMERGQQVIDDNRTRSGRFLGALIDVLSRSQVEADSMEQDDHPTRQINVDAVQDVSRHYVVSDLSDKKDQMSNCSRDGERQHEMDGKTAVTSGSFTKQNTINSGSNKSQRKYGDAQPVYGAFQQSQRTLPNGDTLTTSGLNDQIVQSLISNQGNNVYGFKNCCTLSTISNINTILGRNESESQVVFEAVARNLCRTDYQIPEYNGGMGDAGVQTLLNDVYGVETICKSAGSLSPEILGSYIEKGHIVTIGADSGLLWQGLPSGYADHQVLLTKVVRNNSTGKVDGFYMADTGAGRSDGNNVFVNIGTMNKCFFGNRGPFGGVRNATAVISTKQLIQ